MKCLFCNSIDFDIEPSYRFVKYVNGEKTLYINKICSNGHLLQHEKHNKVTEGSWIFVRNVQFPGRVSHIQFHDPEFKVKLSELRWNIDDIDGIIQKYINQQKILKNERNTSRTSWLLCSLRLREWINRDIAKMIGTYLSLKPFYFWKENEVSLL